MLMGRIQALTICLDLWFDHYIDDLRLTSPDIEHVLGPLYLHGIEYMREFTIK